MEKVRKATEQLIEAMKESDVYIRYQNARVQITACPSLKKEADEFRKKNYDLQNSRKDIFEEADRLQAEYATLLKNPIVREYLTAENSFCRMIQQVNWKLIEEMDFEADFEGKCKDSETD